ncbi:MAG: SUF system Fe-S cluster assembly regulator [Alphaproteobacteria bacterium]|jgi:FeS assembly SUF system regulator|nr:SUF system Fe-S cluster assembly regulator [Alphaproteobacteria bacterium]
MIKLSRMADYGVILMVQLARAPEQVTTAGELTEATALPGPTVSKLLKQLSRAGLLDSQRGTNGGYTLSQPVDDISVADIISALDGPIALTECMTAEGAVCEIEALCPTRTNWRQINNALVEALDRVSLAEMARPVFETTTIQPARVAVAASV